MTDAGDALPDGLFAEVLRPGDAGYEEARRVHNGLVDKRPALIARCRTAPEVVEAVDFGRREGLEISIRGGGHNVAGICVCEGGLMIDLSPMKGIDVDPERRIVRAQPGVTWSELNERTQAHGLAVTGGVVSSTGIAGLTLGGGIGWLMPKFGLAADNLLSAQVVTADGRVLTASAEENSDLFWGLRGGGGNFGVVTAFEYRLHAVGPTITGGMVIHPFAAAAALLRFFREFCAGLSDDVMLNAALLHAPDDPSVKLAAVVLAHFGAAEEAEKELAPLLGFGSPLDVQVGPMPYTVLNSLLDDAFPSGALNYWKSSFLNGLPDEAIDAIVRDYASCPSPMTKIVIEHFHGAVARVEVEATAVPHREDGYDFLITSVWTDPASTDENIAWTRAAFDSVQPHASARRYVNYLAADDTGTDPVRAAYGANYERLVALKTKYDPDNLFHLNFNISPRATVV
ncbi:MAG TPA: FAD-binding oxidoreductase [Gaiellaceae bacterium]|nr:FAD-binding oxidoreductase [Gaiellaceae bacterium]